jgi:hypothetical protein
MIRYYGRATGILLVAMITLSSCASTRFFSEWMDEAYKNKPLETVLIVAISDNLATRKLFETQFAEEFKRVGVNAASSADVTPTDKELTKEVIKATAEAMGMKAVMVTHLLSVDEETVYHPSAAKPVPGAYYYDFDSYYSRVDTQVQYPGHYSKSTFYRLETNLYETQTAKLIWSVSSETIDPDTVNDVIDSLAKAIMENLRKNGLVKSPVKK